MIASMSGRPIRAARTTDSGVPPTPTHVRSGRPFSTGGYTVCPLSGERVCPDQVTGPPAASAANSASRSSNSALY